MVLPKKTKRYDETYSTNVRTQILYIPAVVCNRQPTKIQPKRCVLINEVATCHDLNSEHKI